MSFTEEQIIAVLREHERPLKIRARRRQRRGRPGGRGERDNRMTFHGYPRADHDWPDHAATTVTRRSIAELARAAVMDVAILVAPCFAVPDRRQLAAVELCFD
jgi:hypothetical protein